MGIGDRINDIIIKSVRKISTYSNYYENYESLDITLSGKGVFDGYPLKELRKVFSVEIRFYPEKEDGDIKYSNIRYSNNDEHLLVSQVIILYCKPNVYALIEQCVENLNQIKVALTSKSDWKTSGSDDVNYMQVALADLEILPAGTYSDDFVASQQASVLREALIEEYCGGSHNGQIYEVCKELAPTLAKSLSKIKSKNDLYDYYQTLRELFPDIRLTLHVDTYTPYDRMYGKEFYNAIDDLPLENKQAVIAAYNNVWSRIPAIQLFKDGFKWPLRNSEAGVWSELDQMIEKYLSLNAISPTLDMIFVDLLLCSAISKFAQDSQMLGYASGEEILDVKPIIYLENKYLNIDKLPKLDFFNSIVKMVGILIGFAIRGAVIWFVSSFIASVVASEYDAARYIIFAAFLAAERVVWYFSEQTSLTVVSDKLKTERQESYIALLTDMCLLHSKSIGMNTGLLKHLLYRFEEKGVDFSPILYRILDK